MGIEKVNKHLGELFFYALTKNLIKDKNIHQSLQELSVILDLKNVEMMPLLNHKDFDDLMEPLLNDAAQRCLFEPNTLFERDAFEAKIIDALMPRPNEVKSQFQTLYANNPEDATHYLYRLSVDVNYIKSKRLKNNIEWIHPSIYGLLQMTINLAKPEKDPKEIAASRNREEPIYEHRPQCVLCKENERNYWNARMNLRMVPITLGHEQWHFQYSPYLYYPEHAIILH
ncbi:MAG: galactose-1-phosphate uridylyltransferase, partial [Acholeplasmataceae bacterium]|nr:galactose-1-phosphate uridylyltransferase [Acholeplasmataceae bacterium]